MSRSLAFVHPSIWLANSAGTVDVCGCVTSALAPLVRRDRTCFLARFSLFRCPRPKTNQSSSCTTWTNIRGASATDRLSADIHFLLSSETLPIGRPLNADRTHGSSTECSEQRHHFLLLLSSNKVINKKKSISFTQQLHTSRLIRRMEQWSGTERGGAETIQ